MSHKTVKISLKGLKQGHWVLSWFAIVASDDPTVSFLNWEFVSALVLPLSILQGTVAITFHVTHRTNINGANKAPR